MVNDVLKSNATADSIAVLVVDDHALFREGIVNYLKLDRGLRVLGAVSSGEEALALLSRVRVDVVLLDLRLGLSDGLQVLPRIKSNSMATKVLVVSSHDGDAIVRRAMTLGADGYVSKSVSSAELVAAIRKTHEGQRAISPDIADGLACTLNQPELSDREIEILQHIAAGLTNKEVGVKLGVEEKTIKNRLVQIFLKLRASDRTHAVVLALERGFISLPTRRKP